MGIQHNLLGVDHKGTNVVGHFVLTKELLPLLLATAKNAPGETRVIWTSSNGHSLTPKGIISFEDINLSKENGWVRYGQSKAVIPFNSCSLSQRQRFCSQRQ
jgi:NAD(P)-dependent dehydrogenase (short-subunit alcohol dehydrogenase family)